MPDTDPEKPMVNFSIKSDTTHNLKKKTINKTITNYSYLYQTILVAAVQGKFLKFFYRLKIYIFGEKYAKYVKRPTGKLVFLRVLQGVPV